MPSLLVPIRAKLTISMRRRVWELLEGNHASVFLGRSMEFEDLRDYVPGDDLKDIDWKATARTGHPLVKRHVAQRLHDVLFVVDSGRGMAAHCNPDELKRDVAIGVVGTIGSVAVRGGDLVALAHGSAERTTYVPLRGSLAHLERMLQSVHAATTPDAPPSDVFAQLEFVARTVRRRMLIVVVAGSATIDAERERILRRLLVQHELLWVTVGDVDPTQHELDRRTVLDVDGGGELPALLRRSTALRAELEEATAEHAYHVTRSLQRLGITSVRITSSDGVVAGVVQLLEGQRRAVRSA